MATGCDLPENLSQASLLQRPFPSLFGILWHGWAAGESEGREAAQTGPSVESSTSGTHLEG